jgi:hypothetical protein
MWMSEDSDDFQAAIQLIEQHGDGAALVAANRVSTACERGEMASLRRWSRILAMVERIQSKIVTDGDDESELCSRL